MPGPATGSGSGSAPLLPRYGESSLAEVLPALVGSLAAAWGLRLPGAVGDPAGPLRLAPVRRAALLLVDGLGWEALLAHPQQAPFLAALAAEPRTGRPLAVGFPTTTATSMGSLGTGRPPGRHGMVGLQMAVPGTDRVLDCLHWDEAVDPRAWQPLPTWFEQAAAAGVAVTRVGPAAFAGSGLTEATLRGGRYVGAETAGERVAATLAALRDSGPALAYCYVGDLDGTGHRRGCGSAAWRFQLAHVDRLAEQIAAGLPADAALWVTADHGMVDVPPAARLDLATEPDLAAGVRLLGGEPRARHVYTVPGAGTDVLAAWRARLGGSTLVLPGDEAVAAGWFGPVAEWVRPRIGDVVAAALGPVGVVDSRREPAELLALVGHHGSLTPAEVLVPLLEARPG